MPDTGIADGSTLTSSIWDTYVRQQVVAQVTSATRPTSIDGRLIYQTDNTKLMAYETTTGSWVEVADLRDWDTYTPTLTNVTTGNGTTTGVWRRAGRWVEFAVQFTLGTTSAITGLIGVSLPATSARTWAHVMGGQMIDSGVTVYPAVCWWGTTSRIDLYAMNVAGTYASSTATTALIPFTWGTADYFVLSGTYEAAASA